ncbi:MAG TPA: hypothetical protein VF373_11315 [Prolixibacteraceae bacterium]
MKDYYFLLIAVALSIFGAIKQNMKKVDDKNPLPGKAERPRNFFLDQLLGEGFLDEPKESVAPPKRVNPAPAIPASGITKDSNTGELYHPGFKHTLPDPQKRNVILTVQKPVAKEVGPDLESDDTPSYLEDFSLRKAFVYSEIMARKYELSS